MTTNLDVINACLATLGEAPLNSDQEQHEFKAAAQRIIARSSKTIQSTGWWFNTEDVVLTPDPVHSQIVLANDVLLFRSGTVGVKNGVYGVSQPWLTQRGRRIYDTKTHSYTLVEDAIGEIIREVPLDELPPVVADLIEAHAVLRFQTDFDADSSRNANLAGHLKTAQAIANSENIRQRSVNLVRLNPRLQRIKRVANRSI